MIKIAHQGFTARIKSARGGRKKLPVLQRMRSTINTARKAVKLGTIPTGAKPVKVTLMILRKMQVISLLAAIQQMLRMIQPVTLQQGPKREKVGQSDRKICLSG